MRRPLGTSLNRLAWAPVNRRRYVTDADVETARRYCLQQLQYATTLCG